MSQSQSINKGGKGGAPLRAQQRCSYSSSADWTAVKKDPQPWSPADLEPEIKKPQTSLYYQPDSSLYGSDRTYSDIVDDMDLEIDDLQRKKGGDTTEAAEVPKPTMRLVPRLGRTVHVSKNVDVARSFKLLAIQVAQNRIRQDFQSQRYHERPGLKRKRLKSERWQRRFKRGFKETVRRVKELTGQGW